ncbi:MAG: sigma-E processing peptidase SpoIIGA, partial [Clostridiales bacterium]
HSFMYAWPVVVGVSLILLQLAYAWQGVGDFLRLAAVFYLIAFAMAGAALAASSFLAEQGIRIGASQTVKGGTLLFALGAAVALGRQGLRLLRKSWQKDNFLVTVEITAAGRRLKLPVLIDTGNNLSEPVSGLPVIVTSYTVVRELFPQGLKVLFQQYGAVDPAEIIQHLNVNGDADGWAKRLRLIPFSSIGKNHGLLLGFRPDKVVVTAENGCFIAQAIVGLSPRELTGEDFTAVMNPQIMMGGEKIREAGA